MAEFLEKHLGEEQPSAVDEDALAERDVAMAKAWNGIFAAISSGKRAKASAAKGG